MKKQIDKCDVCNNAAKIIRHVSGEKYCIKHFELKLKWEVTNILKKSPPTDKITVFTPKRGQHYKLAQYLSDWAAIKGRKVTIVDISDVYVHIDLENDAAQISNLYKECIDKTSEYTVVLFRTAEEIAHDILILILMSQFDLLKKINMSSRRIYTPLKKFFNMELKYLSRDTIEHKCITMKLLERASLTKPSVIFSIINYSKHWL